MGIIMYKVSYKFRFLFMIKLYMIKIKLIALPVYDIDNKSLFSILFYKKLSPYRIHINNHHIVKYTIMHPIFQQFEK